MNNKEKLRICPNCGAPVRSEICQYCGQVMPVETKDMSAEYPTLECNNASLTFFDTFFPLIFAIGFGGFGLMMPVMFYLSGELEPLVLLCFIPFALIGVIATFVVLRSLYRYFSTLFFGKEVEAMVYGYMDDTVAYNGNNGQIVKLLINTKRGKRFIFYPTKNTNKPYVVNDKIKIKAYKNSFIVMKEQLNDEML